MQKTSWSKPATITSDLDEISQFIEEQLKAWQISRSALHDVLVAVLEAVTNIIIHGYRENPGFLEIRLFFEKDVTLTVHVRDQASFFDPTQLPAPDISVPLEKRAMGGMGVHLIHQLMDQILYLPLSPNGNELIMIKKLDF